MAWLLTWHENGMPKFDEKDTEAQAEIAAKDKRAGAWCDAMVFWSEITSSLPVPTPPDSSAQPLALEA